MDLSSFIGISYGNVLLDFQRLLIKKNALQNILQNIKLRKQNKAALFFLHFNAIRLLKMLS